MFGKRPTVLNDDTFNKNETLNGKTFFIERTELHFFISVKDTILFLGGGGSHSLALSIW